MKKLRILIFVFLILVIPATCFYAFWLEPKYTVPILTYHHFGSEKDNTLYVTPENFSKQMEYLKGNGYTVISLDDLVEGIKSNKKFAHKTVVITSDDGYEDNYTYAFPVLQKHNFPATIFLVSRYVDRKSDYLSKSQARQMAQCGVSLGGHTKNHVYLPNIKDENILWDEIAGCRKDLQEKLGLNIRHFCYPTGGFNERIKILVKEAGYSSACTTNRGDVKYNKDLYELKRIKVTNSDANKPFGFWAKLSGYYNLFKSTKAGE